MEDRHVVVAEVVGFVVVFYEGDRLEERESFSFPEGAFSHSQDKPSCFYRELRLPSGELCLDPGFNEKSKVGDRMYGQPCSGCGEMTWWPFVSQGRALCENC